MNIKILPIKCLRSDLIHIYSPSFKHHITYVPSCIVLFLSLYFRSALSFFILSSLSPSLPFLLFPLPPSLSLSSHSLPLELPLLSLPSNPLYVPSDTILFLGFFTFVLPFPFPFFHPFLIPSLSLSSRYIDLTQLSLPCYPLLLQPLPSYTLSLSKNDSE